MAVEAGCPPRASEGSGSFEPEQVKVGGGQVLTFSKFGLEVETKKFLRRPVKCVIMWDTISRIDIEMECFSGTINLAVSTGQTYQISCGKQKLMHVAATLYHFTRRSAAGERPVSISPEARQILQKHRKVGLCNDGILLKKNRGCCRSSVKFVPWGALISVSLSRDRRNVTARTTLGPQAVSGEAPPAEGQEEAATEPQEETTYEQPAEGEANAPEEERDEAARQEEELGNIKIPGSKKLSEALFHEMVRMMSEGQSEEQLAPDIGDKVATAKLSQAGVLVEHRTSFLGGVDTYFVPWASLVCASWQPAGLFSKRRLSVRDMTGCQVNLRGARFEDFEAFCSAFQNAVRETEVRVGPPRATAGAQRGLAFSEDGAHLQTATCCGGPCACCRPQGRRHYFVPWAKIDGLELRAGCCLGRAILVTESGDRLQAAKTCCGAAALWKIYEELHGFKYGLPSEHPPLASFNRQRNERFTSELNGKSIRVASGSTVREWDLERVVGCSTSPEYRRERGLLLHLQTGTGRREEVRIPIRSATSSEGADLSAKELAVAVLCAAAARRQHTRTGMAPTEVAAAGFGKVLPGEAAAKRIEAPVPERAVEEPRPLPPPEPPAVEEPQVEEFLVVIDREVSADNPSNCGLVTFQRRSIVSDDVALYVSAVTSGPVELWNELNPDHEVRQGDFIVEVNGCRNDFVNMLQSLQRPHVELVVRRGRWP